MPHGGYHGTQVIGGKITQLGDEFKDSQGNIKPQFNVTGDKDSGFNVSMANETFNPRAREAMYAGPDDILQNIIDRKDVLKLQPSPDRPGMNLYQDTIQDFRTSSPTNMAAYADRFPLTQFMMEGPKAIAQNTLLGNIISAIGGGKNKVGEFASGLFPQGFMPGLGAEVDRFTTQLAAAPGEFKEDFVKMFTKDDEPTKANLREDFDIKKNTAEDIVEGSLFKEEEMQGTPVQEAFFDQSTIDEFLRRNNQFTPATTKDELAQRAGIDPNNIGQIVNFIRDNSGYFDRVINKLGIGGR